MNTSIGKRGYTLLKEELSSLADLQYTTRTAVKPFISDYGPAPCPFHCVL